MNKKYFTEEERKQAKKEYNTKYHQAHKEKIAKRKAEYYQANKEAILENKAEYYQKNKDKIAEYYQVNKEAILEYQTKYQPEYRLTPKGRAVYLCKEYVQADKKHNRGECTLTADWIVENIFSQPCHYCGETDWRELGCDRIDNALPHTPENVVPCCKDCNMKRMHKSYDEFMKMIGKVG